MDKFELIAPCHFGMEAVQKREILDLGYEIITVEDGKVTFQADAQGIADANMFLRSTERILLKVAEVKAQTFDELFQALDGLREMHLDYQLLFIEAADEDVEAEYARMAKQYGMEADQLKKYIDAGMVCTQVDRGWPTAFGSEYESTLSSYILDLVSLEDAMKTLDDAWAAAKAAGQA